MIHICRTCDNSDFAKCDWCDGTGGWIETEDGWMDECPDCRGYGKVKCSHKEAG